LSYANRDPLSAEISAYGWRVSSARRGKNLSNRFLASNALIALVDVRGSIEEGLLGIEKLAAVAQNVGIAIIVLADMAEDGQIAAKAFDAGATHFHDMGNARADLEQAINFAYRHVEYIRGGPESTRSFNAILTQSDEEWSFSKTTTQHWISDKMRSNLTSFDFQKYPVTAIYRRLSSAERARVKGAMGRLREGSAQAAIAHMLDGQKVIHHLHDAGDKIHGRIERIAENATNESWTERDLLSGLRNGSSARSWIKEKLETGKSLGLISLGLKNFGTINAAYGRTLGDQILRLIGQRLLAETADHSSDKCVVARIDGQNFIVAAVIDQSSQDLQDYAQRLLDVIFGPVRLEGRVIQLVARAGVAIGDGAPDETLLIRRASLALTEAMASDSTPLKISASSEKDILLEQELESELAQGIENGNIVIALQPQLRVDDGHLVGAEALARWSHPEFGFLGAATLFAVAERAGLMEILSKHIITRVLAIAADWPDSLSFLRVSINVTAGDLADRNFFENMMQNIEESGFSASRITLEITESELIGDMDGAVKQLAALREKDVRIAIDDFGTGYSSLAYLKDLPLDYLKIDSGLTGDISGSAKDQVVVKSIIDMAHSLELAVIAEGVETEAQLETLATQDCEYFQGFLRSGPLSPQEFEVFALRSN